MPSSKSEQARPTKQDAYERPLLTVLGSVAEVTAGVPANGGADIIFSSAAPSDRRLKEGLRAISPRHVLAGLAGLPL
jgi:hypothetical protein